MEYALLYCFSTIPQTLAAALGVLAAFVLYRLQSDSEPRWNDARELIGHFGGEQRTALDDLLTAQRYSALLAELERKYAGGSPPLASTQYQCFGRLKTSLRTERAILIALKQAFFVTAAVILLSIFVLTVAHAFWKCTVIAVPVLFAGWASVALCLWLYWRLVRAALWGEKN
jgi:hypothetical protein